MGRDQEAPLDRRGSLSNLPPPGCVPEAPADLPRIERMSGHSKWSSIKHKKGAADAKRGQLFTKLARSIQVAAREGGPDPAGNAALATAVQKARDASMPKDNIERAIAKGAGSDADADAFESAVYEGYAPGGVAVLVEALTDNRNRTGSEIRHLFGRHGGSLGEPGSVAWNFDKKGVVLVDVERHDEDDLIIAIDAGAEDLTRDENVWEIVTAPADLQAVREALEEAGVQTQSADLTMRPQSRVGVAEGQVTRVLRLLEELEDQDDVSAVYANFDIDAATLERMAPA
jgi:YebC/PmpR family DNA-binding regulatory protein